MAHELLQYCWMCNGSGVVTGQPCEPCAGTGRLHFGAMPETEAAIAGLVADVASLGDICKKILEIVGKT